MYRITCILILLFSIYSCENTKQQEVVKYNYVINIKVDDAKNESKLFLKQQKDNLNLILDSVNLKNGAATFSGNIETPEVFGIFIEGNPEGIFPIVEEGTISIQANIDQLNKAKIFGTPLNDQLNEFKENIKNISSKMNDLFHDFQKARAENDPTKIAEINQKMNLINEELTAYKVNFIIQNNNSFVSSMVLYSLANERIIKNSKLDSLYHRLSDNVKQSVFAKNTRLLLDLNKISTDTLK